MGHGRAGSAERLAHTLPRPSGRAHKPHLLSTFPPSWCPGRVCRGDRNTQKLSRGCCTLRRGAPIDARRRRSRRVRFSTTARLPLARGVRGRPTGTSRFPRFCPGKLSRAPRPVGAAAHTRPRHRAEHENVVTSRPQNRTRGNIVIECDSCKRDRSHAGINNLEVLLFRGAMTYTLVFRKTSLILGEFPVTVRNSCNESSAGSRHPSGERSC